MGLFELFPILFILTHSAIDHSSLDGSVLDSITFDKETTEKFGGETEYKIGWKRVFFCNEIYPSSTADDVFRYTGNGGELDSSEFVALAPYAITAKIVPENIVPEGEGLTQQEFDNYAVYAKVCQNPIIALNNLLEMSYVVNVDTLQYVSTNNKNNWFGTQTAVNRLGFAYKQSISPITTHIFHSAGRGNLFNVLFTGPGQGWCSWDMYNIHNDRSIAIYFGFDTNRKNVCDGKGIGGLITLPNCNSNDDCNDDNLCTNDICNDNNRCENGENVVCKFGEKCVPNTGCVSDCTAFDIDEFTEECSSSIVLKTDIRQRNSIGSIFDIQVKDSSIITLLIVNLMLMIMFHIYWYRQIKKQKYQTYQKVEIEIADEKPANKL